MYLCLGRYSVGYVCARVRTCVRACDAQGSFFIGVIVVAEIRIGDEILVDYGDECVCVRARECMRAGVHARVCGRACARVVRASVYVCARVAAGVCAWACACVRACLHVRVCSRCIAMGRTSPTALVS